MVVGLCKNQKNRLWISAQLCVLGLPLVTPWSGLGLLIVIAAIWRRDYLSISQKKLNRILGILALWLLLTCGFASYPLDAFLGLANFLPFFGLFASFSLLIKRPVQLYQLAWCLVIPSLPIVILGCGQIFAHWETPAPIFWLFGWQLFSGGVPIGRMSSVFSYANIFGAYLLMSFFLALGLWLHSKQQQQPIALTYLTIVIIADMMAIILTSSRSAWAIALFGLFLFSLYRYQYYLATIITMIAVSIGAASLHSDPFRLRHLIPAYFWARLSDEMYSDRPIATLRITQWQFVLDLIQQKPWLGWGLRNFSPLYLAKTEQWLGHPHNLWLMLLSETGIPLTIALCLVVGWILAKGVILIIIFAQQGKKAHELILFTYLMAFSSCMLFNLLDVSIFDFRLNTLGWIILSAIAGIGYRYEKILPKELVQGGL